jgi:hypothetical protein
VKESQGFKNVQEFSEQTTIQGMAYIFGSGMNLFTRMFWLVVVVAMLATGTYWSIQMYIDWNNNQVPML